MSTNNGIINVFVPGVKRGEEVSEYAKKMGYGEKKYFFVIHPKQGWKVFIRACCFIHVKGKSFDPSKFVVVKTTDASPKTKSWEPPKGQMEGKDGLKNPRQSLMNIMKENLQREVEEESKITKLKNIQHTGLVLQSKEKQYDDNTYFQYHIFQAFIDETEFDKAKSKLIWYKEHPEEWKKLRMDEREKDDIEWFNPKTTKIYGRWSPSIVALYLNNIR